MGRISSKQAAVTSTCIAQRQTVLQLHISYYPKARQAQAKMCTFEKKKTLCHCASIMQCTNIWTTQHAVNEPSLRNICAKIEAFISAVLWSLHITAILKPLVVSNQSPIKEQRMQSLRMNAAKLKQLQFAKNFQISNLLEQKYSLTLLQNLQIKKACF